MLKDTFFFKKIIKIRTCMNISAEAASVSRLSLMIFPHARFNYVPASSFPLWM
jgi:hypothetical protein